MGDGDKELIRRGYEAFNSGDMAALQELFAPDAVWHTSGNNPLSGDYKGQDIFAMFGRLMGEAQGTFRNEIHALTEGDGHVIAITHATASRNGKTLDADAVQVFHVNDGKVTEVWNTPWDQAAADDFWS